MVFIIAAALSFLIGSIPFAVIVTRAVGVDVRTVGSGNPGFSNAMRAVGITKALPVLIADIGKGSLGAYLALALGGNWWAAMFVVLGHCFSPWLGFRGGKGVATFVGVTLVANPLIGGCAMIAWAILFAIFRIASLASLLSVAIIVTGILWLMPALSPEFLLIALLIFWRHRKNIGHLLRHTEPKLTL